jgi:AcrR family transcriptional regulator
VSAKIAPTKTLERAQAQRDRILQAAQRCFVQHGFHAASMASIAETAGMSAGLIYRYFESKNAIIVAIIERQLVEKSGNIASLQSAPELRRRILDLFTGWQQGDGSVMNAALFLEMSAQATRDADTAAALAESDRITGAQFQEWLRQQAIAAGADPDSARIRERALILGAFIEGLAIRAVREPGFDAAVVSSAVDMLLPHVLAFGANPA